MYSLLLLILIFVLSGIVRLILRHRSLKKEKIGLFKKRIKRDKIETRSVKSDDERRLRFEKLEKSNFVGFSGMGEETMGGIGIMEGRELNEEKMDTISKRKLKDFKSSDFRIKEFENKPMDWDNTDEVKEVKVSLVSKLNKLKPFARAVVWKEILDKPKSEHF